MKGVVQVRGDYGNPNGTGYAKISVDNLESADAATALTVMDTFVDSLKTGGFTGCNVGKTSVTVEALQGADKPAADVSIDDQLIVSYTKSTEGKARTLTISGIDPDSALLTPKSEGRRLTDAGIATLEGYINTLFGWTGLAKISVGKFVSKR